MIRDCLPAVVEDRDLTTEQAESAMRDIIAGEATPSQVSAFLIALKKKGETVEEITALARIMRSFSQQVHPRVDGCLVDTCGTGGDSVKTFNVSTTAAFVVASAGVRVAKHGNRSFTSRCGSADLLEQLGLNLEMGPTKVEESIEKLGIGFMFAPNFHPAMKNVATIRREIGVRTVFNILGPLTNSANASAQLIGVYHPNLLEPMCMAARNLGVKSVMTVYALDGIDEISLSCNTRVLICHNGEILRREVTPEDFGLPRTKIEDVLGYGPEENAKIAARILSGKLPYDSPNIRMVAANAAGALVLAEAAGDLKDGVEIALQAIGDGTPFKLLRDLVEFSGGISKRLDAMV